MKVSRCFVLRQDELYCRGIVSAALVQFIQTLEAMPGTRALVAHPSHLGITITYRFVALDHGMNCRFALRIEFRKVFANDRNFFVQLVGFGLMFRMLRCGAFAFASQSFSLYCHASAGAFELAGDLAQSLSYCSM